MEYALNQIGDPYVWAAAGPDAFDCSGLTMSAAVHASRPGKPVKIDPAFGQMPFVGAVRPG